MIVRGFRAARWQLSAAARRWRQSEGRHALRGVATASLAVIGGTYTLNYVLAEDVDNESGESHEEAEGMKLGRVRDFVTAKRDHGHQIRNERHRARGEMAIFAGGAHPSLAEEIAIELGTKVGKLQLKYFADGEESVLVDENVRGKDVYVIQPTGFPVHHNLIQLLLIISALRGCSANHVTAVIPYFGYKRDVGGPSSPFSARMFAMQRQQEHEASPETDILYDPMTPSQLRRALREMELSQVGVPLRPGMTEDEMNQAMEEKEPPMVPISAAEVARMMEAMGVDAVISVDLQPPGHGQIEGFFGPRVSVENLRGVGLGAEQLARRALHRPVVVAPQETLMHLAKDFRSGLEHSLGYEVGIATILEGGNRPRPMSGETQADRPLDIVGEVEGRDVVIVDDAIDTARSLVRRVRFLKAIGARNVYAFATHGLFNGRALDRIERSPLTEVIVTNSVQLGGPDTFNSNAVKRAHTRKITQVSIAPLLAEAILRSHNGMSLQHLRVFDSKSYDPRKASESF